MAFIARRIVAHCEGLVFDRLERVLGGSTRLLAQVALSQIVGETDNDGTRNETRRFLYSSSVDFLIADRNLMPLAVVELQSPYHNNDAARERDRKKRDLLDAAGIPLLYAELTLATGELRIGTADGAVALKVGAASADTDLELGEFLRRQAAKARHLAPAAPAEAGGDAGLAAAA